MGRQRAPMAPQPLDHGRRQARSHANRRFPPLGGWPASVPRQEILAGRVRSRHGVSPQGLHRGA